MKGTNLIVGDNSGGKIVQCINVMGSSKQRYAAMGKVLLVTAKKVKSGKKIKKKKFYQGILINTRKEKRRNKGYYVKFDRNRVLLMSDQNKFLGTRIYGPIPKEIKYNRTMAIYKPIISHAKSSV